MPGLRGGSSGSRFQGGGSGRAGAVELRFGGDGQQLRERVFAEDLVDALGGTADGRRGDERVRGGDQFEVLFGMCERVVRDQRGDVRELGRFGAEEFAACRRVEEEIGDGDGGSARQGGVFDVDEFCRRRFRCECRGRSSPVARFERDACDGSDGRQRFAAKAEGGNREQFVGGAQLRGCVTLEGEERIVAIHAVAVVGDADELAAAGFDFDADAIGAGVERVFEQFFDDGGGTIDHLTGSNLIGHLVGKNTNAPHGESVSGTAMRRDRGARDRCTHKKAVISRALKARLTTA